MHLSPRAALALARYRRVLPRSELQALQWWAQTFWPFQQEWLFDDSRFAFLNKSRKIGFSHTTAGTCALWGIFHGETTTIISIGDREAMEVLELVRKHAQLIAEAGSLAARTGRAVRRKQNAHELQFASGGRVIALPATGGRSYSGNVFLDEYAYHQHDDKVWDAAGPVIVLGYKIRVVSTPNGVGNDFHNLYEIANGIKEDTREVLKKKRWSPHQITIAQAIAQGYPVDLEDCWLLAKGDPRLFDQMFNCSFLDNELQYLPTDAINGCARGDVLTALTGGECYAGLDVGLEADLSVLVVVRVINGLRYVVHVESMKRTDSDGLEDMVARAFERYDLRRLCIDATGLGTFPAQRMKKKHSERIDVPWRRPRVECIKFTPTSKEALATGLYTALTDQVVVLPDSDAALPPIVLVTEPDSPTGKAIIANRNGTAKRMKQDLAAIRRIITPAGNVKYDAPRTAEGHADHAWGLALALHACSSPNAMVEALSGGAR